MKACSLGPAGRLSFPLAAAVIVGCITGARAAIGEQQSGCQAYDSTWIGELSDYQAMASDTDSITAVGRARYHLPQLPGDSVSFVSDPRDMHASSSGIRTESRRSGYDNISPGHPGSIRSDKVRRRRSESESR